MKFKRILSALLVSAIAVSATACSGGSTGSKTSADANTASSAVTDSLPTIDSLKLGIDYTNIKADLKFITHKTDCVDTVFAKYIKDFQKTYPNIKITYEGITDYEKEMATRLPTKDWGDICMLPAFISTNKADMATYFVPLGDEKTLSKTYYWTNQWMYNGKSYGMPSNGNVQGLIYNKKVWKDAGVTELPKTPDDFLTDLKKIKDTSKGSIIPLYTNFAAQWTMTAWDAYIGGCATGSEDYMNVTLPHTKDPFIKQSNMTGPYAVYYTLYEAAKRHLIEKDPTTTDWEGSKPLMNKGKIATMALGAWAVSQVQSAGKNSKDIGYMPFPITVNGKQYATMAGDYNYCVNATSSNDKKIASMLYIKWLVQKSDFAARNGVVSTVKADPLPSILSDSFKNIDLIVDNPAPKGEESLLGNISSESELGINSDYTHVASIVEAAEEGNKTLDQIVAQWNKKWTSAQNKYKAIK